MVDHPFSGSALCAVDAAGIVLLPPFILATMQRRSDAGAVMIGVHEADPCLSAYDRGHLSALYADHERRRMAEYESSAHYRRARTRFGSAEETSCDAHGTITLPAIMRRKVGIGDIALLVGAGGTFEMWNPQTALGGDDPHLRELAAWRFDDVFASAN